MPHTYSPDRALPVEAEHIPNIAGQLRNRVAAPHSDRRSQKGVELIHCSTALRITGLDTDKQLGTELVSIGKRIAAGGESGISCRLDPHRSAQILSRLAQSLDQHVSKFVH